MPRRPVAGTALVDRIDLRKGSATAIPFDPASCDVVVARECAFHVHTGVRFFQGAWTVSCQGSGWCRRISSPRLPGRPRPKATGTRYPAGGLPQR